MLPDLKSSSILNIGCGDRNFVYYLYQKGCKDAKGIDLSEEVTQTGDNLGIPGLEFAD